jgi:hypothetical protein
MFDRTGDRAGTVATSSFLCLAKPTDHRVPGWLADGLAWADQAGDRSKQITTLTTLAWHHFFRSLWGRPEETAEAEGFARRLGALSEELGATDMAVHGYSLVTITERFSGRLDDAVRHASALERLAAAAGNPDPWLGWAASFAVAVANGVASASPPFPPANSPDPVAGMASVGIEAELALSGRHDEAVARIEQADRPELGPIGELAGIIPALALVLAGQGADALGYLERAAHAARRLSSPPALLAAAALRAEITTTTAQLPAPPPTAQGVSEALLLRAHAVGGSTAAAESLRRAAKELAMPGLLVGI